MQKTCKFLSGISAQIPEANEKRLTSKHAVRSQGARWYRKQNQTETPGELMD